MKTILFVHQAADMYGSDKVLLDLVKGIDKERFHPIVLLPCNGPLLYPLQEAGIETYILPLLRVSRASFSSPGLLSLPFEGYHSYLAMNRALSSVDVDVVHSHTLAVLSGALWARIRGIPHVWHVHEMIVNPRLVRSVFAWLLRIFATQVVCNSKATRRLLLDTQPALARNSVVVWNGFERTERIDREQVDALRYQFGLGEGDLLVALVGRINRWKGQGLLVEAAGLLWERGVRNLRYLIVGSTSDGQEYFKDELTARIAASPVRDKITVMDFKHDIATIWDACDIAVVPSTEPEPFGMVALEAMAAEKPVIAAAHGGLVEIVKHGETGLLFEPGRPEELADAIASMADDKKKRHRYGEAGLRSLTNLFSLHKYISSFENIYTNLLR
jgi:glycosyltransferase involved in cell wall biosynthesis